jgi:antirestriction protein
MEQEPNDDQSQNREEYAREVSPRIYVASLSDYNDGRLFGQWLNANQSPDELYAAVRTMLKGSSTPNAEEWGIFDYEGFGPIRIDEYEDLDSISLLASGISEHGEAFSHWVDLTDERDENSVLNFLGSYLGCFDSLEEYVGGLVEDLGFLGMVQPQLPEFLERYVSFDIEGLARDLELSGEIMTSRGRNGLHVYDTRW